MLIIKCLCLDISDCFWLFYASKYTSGFYRNQRYAFNPCHDSYQDGYDWTASLNPSEFKIPIPQEMFTALNGIALDVPSWEEGIPEDLQPAMDRLADLVDE